MDKLYKIKFEKSFQLNRNYIHIIHNINNKIVTLNYKKKYYIM